MGAVVELLDYHKQQREERPFRVLASARFISSLADLRDFPRATCILVRRDAAGSARVFDDVARALCKPVPQWRGDPVRRRDAGRQRGACLEQRIVWLSVGPAAN